MHFGEERYARTPNAAGSAYQRALQRGSGRSLDFAYPQVRKQVANGMGRLDGRRSPRVVTAETKAEMKRILNDIQSGKFTRDWMLENRVNQTSFKAMRAKCAAHPIEQVGEKLRAMMPWIKARALVDKARN